MPSIAAEAAKEYRASQSNRHNANLSDFYKASFESLVEHRCVQKAENHTGWPGDPPISIYRFQDQSYLVMTGPDESKTAAVAKTPTEQGIAQLALDQAADPAGRLLRLALENGAVKRGDFTLSSGHKSSFYFDGQLITLDPRGTALVTDALLPIIRDANAGSAGGPATGAYPIAAAIALASLREDNPVPGFVVRDRPKSHGTTQMIEGHLPLNGRAAVVDDVCTTGASLLLAIQAVEARGCDVVKVAVILDRNAGGSQDIRDRGYDFQSLLEVGVDGRIHPTSR